MADKKISALTAASTPLAGTEVLPIVQGGATVKVSVDNLTTGKVVTTGPIISVGTGKDRLVIEPQNAGTGALLLGTNSAGNAYTPVAIDNSTTILKVAGTEVARTNSNGIAPVAGKGIDFSANGGDVLSQYDEGTFTPAWGGSGGDPTCSYSSQTGRYTRVGNIVYCWVEIVTSAKSGGSGNLQIKGLPFAARDAELNAGFASGFSANFPSGCFANSTTTVTMTNTVPSVEQAYLGIGTLGASSYLACTIMYRIA